MWDAFPSTGILTLAQDDIAPIAPAGASNNGETGTSTPGGATGTGADGSAPAQRPAGPFSDSSFLFMILAIFVGMILIQIMTQRKDRKKRESLLSAIKKGDRVRTIGGEHGSVMEVREHTVLLKVDENNNTRIWYDRSAVQSIVQEKQDKPDKQDTQEMAAITETSKSDA